MKKILMKAILIALPVFGYSQIFQEDFDGKGPGILAWTIIDNDGLKPEPSVSSIVANGWNSVDRKGVHGNFGGPSRNYAAVSTSAYESQGKSNDWLISPQIDIPESNLQLKWEAKAQDSEYRDGYKVMLSVNGGTAISDFTETLIQIPEEEATWQSRSVDLSPYAGKSIRFAFVNNSQDKFLLFVDNVKIEAPNVIPAPQCITMNTPANGAKNVEYLPIIHFKWESLGGEVGEKQYEIYRGTSPESMELYQTTIFNELYIEGDQRIKGSTTYYWKVVLKGEDPLSAQCPISSFTTVQSIAHPYCGPISFLSGEPITSVVFSGINNQTTHLTPSSDHEFFLDQKAVVVAGKSYPITLQGNTVGNHKNSFYVYIDWNQDKDFDVKTETYKITTPLVNSTGIDGKTITQDIKVPADALPGSTRMRIKKIYDEIREDSNPCNSLEGHGQAEDYTVNVTNAGLSVQNSSSIKENPVKIYPNPVSSILKVDSQEKIEKIEIYDFSGKMVISKNTGANKIEIPVAKLTPGSYILKTTTSLGTETNKILKK